MRYRARYNKGALDVQADELAQQKGGAVLSKIATIALEGGSFDLQQRKLVFKDLRVADGTLNVVLDEDGIPD